MNNKFNIYYWIRKILVSKLAQFFLPKKTIRKEVFKSIYFSKHWVHSEKNINKEFVSISGPGSNLNKDGSNINILNLNKLIIKYYINSILDVPCGDFIWMKELLKKNPKIKYLGIDIVKDLIVKNLRNYQDENINFECADIFEKTKLNIYNYDLLLCNDFFIHCSCEDIKNFLDKIKKSSFKYFVCDSHIYLKKNKDIEIGKHRKINLLIEPFNLKNPLEINQVYNDRYLLFFKVLDM